MASKGPPRLSKRTVDTLCVQSKDAVFWDRDLPRVWGKGLHHGA